MSVLSYIAEDKLKEFQRKKSLESVYTSNSKGNLLQRRKKLSPLNVDMSSSQHSLNSKAGGDRFITQRVLSAKTHRMKQLQNQLADAHYHLQELSNENRVLRAVQKKHEIALQRYENSNAELPQVLNSHSEEMRVQQVRYKQLKQQYKETTLKLKEREMQLQQLKDEHQHLLELSRDKNLLEREKLQSQVADLTIKSQEQGTTIRLLQRRLELEAKNFRHQLQAEVNRHKDTRIDLDRAINNADKLSSIIEIKEKMSIFGAKKTPVNKQIVTNGTSTRPMSSTVGTKNTQQENGIHVNNEGSNIDPLTSIAKLCENSRNISSALSSDHSISSTIESKSKFYNRSRANSVTKSRKTSEESEEMSDIAKSVQNGMADLSMFDEQIDFKNTPSDEIQKKIDAMKLELVKKIKNNEEFPSRTCSAARRYSTEESIEEEEIVVAEREERPNSRIRRGSTSVTFKQNGIDETAETVPTQEIEKREVTPLERKKVGKYCKDIIQDIEKTSKIIDRHVTELNGSKFESDKLMEQLIAVDKINNFVNQKGEIPVHTLTELNNNFKKISEQVFNETVPVARKRSLSGRRSGNADTRTNVFGDASMSNQDLLDDLLGKK